jgi:glycosyltransferase involved in cell wall biosynthesis
VSRLAFLSPLPPARSGIADYSLDVARLLAATHTLDLFHDDGVPAEAPDLPTSCTVLPAGEFQGRHSRAPYDLAIYQMGNGPAHDFLYDLLPRVPGLLVLHDLVLHHARARMFLEGPAVRAYRADPARQSLRDQAAAALGAFEAEVAYSHPSAAGRLAPVHLGTVGTLLPYQYPLFRIPVEAARAVAVHNDFMRDAILQELPQARVMRVPMAMERVPVAAAQVQALRQRHGVATDDLVVGCFGLLTREKRIDTVARAVARASRSHPRLRFWLVGPVRDARGLLLLLRELGVADRALVTGRVPLAELPVFLEAADVVAHLRYPTARETSAALLRILAQGRPTVMSDLEHLADIPEDAVLRTDVADEEGALTRAILRLAGDAAWRHALGEHAAAFMAREHSGARCREGYESAIAAAMAAPDPPPHPWPAHWMAPAGP